MTDNGRNQLDLVARELKPIPLPVLPENPLVSILTANYNYARFIGEAIESVQKQTYTYWEVIVCDDGSTDNSYDVAEGYARRDSRIKLIRKENGGVATALNAAYELAQGEIVSLLDADDSYCPEKLSVIVGAFRRRASAGFLCHPVQRVGTDGQAYGAYPLLQALPDGAWDPGALQRVHLALPPASGLCLRREVADRIFPLPGFRTNADGILQVLAPLLTPMIAVRCPLANTRMHNANLTQSAKITPEYLDRELGNHRRLWQLQREYLTMLEPVLAGCLPPDDSRPVALLMGYVAARLRGWTGGWRAYRRLTRDEGFFSIHPASRLVWRASILLPGAAFAVLINLMWGRGRLRLVVDKARRFMHNGGVYFGDRRGGPTTHPAGHFARPQAATVGAEVGKESSRDVDLGRGSWRR